MDNPPEYDFDVTSLKREWNKECSVALERTHHEFYSHLNPSLSLSFVFTSLSTIP